MSANIQVVRNLRQNYHRRAIVFTLASVIVFSIFMTFISHNVNIRTYKTESLKVMKNFISRELQFDVNNLLTNPDEYKEVIKRIELFMKMSNLVDFKIWNTEKRVVYAYHDRESIGKYFADNSDLSRVYNSGKIEVNVEDADQAETLELKDHGKLFEMYVPIMHNGRLGGAIEVYRLAPDMNFFGKENIIIGLVTMIIPLLLYGLIGKLFNRAVDTISGYHNDLQKSYGNTTKSYIDTIISLTRALEMRDMETEGHSERVVNLSLFIGEKLGLDKVELGRLVVGSYLHDVGKIGVPDSILLKPGKLDVEERKIIETHVIKGYEIISDVEFLKQAGDVVLYHHEKWDGSGYPEKLKGDDIPLNARIFALVDVFDALRSDRPYKKAFSVEKTMAIIEEGRGSHFDPQVADVLLTMKHDEVLDINKNLDKQRVMKIVHESVASLMDNDF